MSLTPRQKMSREEAEQNIRRNEGTVSQLFRYYQPDDIAVFIAKRFRIRSNVDASARAFPPHLMLRALEASCAYFDPFERCALTDEWFQELVNVLAGFDDPSMELLLSQDSSLMAFMAYIDRSQFDFQRSPGVVSFGRSTFLYGTHHTIPKTAERFLEAFGLTPRQWLRIATILYAHTDMGDKSLGFDDRYMAQFDSVSIPRAAVEAFLCQCVASPQQIKQEYLAIRQDGRMSPLEWHHQELLLCRHPIIRFHNGYAVPSPGLLQKLSDEKIFQLLFSAAGDHLREELSDRFVEYVQATAQPHALPGKLWGDSELDVKDGKKICDIAIELADSILLIECKSVFLKKSAISDERLLKAAATREAIDGCCQVAETASRLMSGGYKHLGLCAGKPIIGIVVTLGRMSHANRDAVLNEARAKCARRGLNHEFLSSGLVQAPIVFGVDAWEYFVLYLQTGSPLQLLSSRAASPGNVLGDWERFIHGQLENKSVKLDWWRALFNDMLENA